MAAHFLRLNRFSPIGAAIAFFLSALVAFAPGAYADDKPDKDDLKEIESLVLESTRSAQTLQETPAIATVMTNDGVITRGYRNLADLLNEIPGYSILLEPTNGNFMRTRGVPNAALLLMNGSSLINPGWNKNYVWDNFDLDLIDRVEVFSSPGGVLWGAHAWLGVVNMITKSGAKNPGAAARIRLGSDGLQKYSLQYGTVWKGVDVFLHSSFTQARSQGLVVRSPPLAISPGSGATSWDHDRVSASRASSYFDLSARVRFKDFEAFARVPVVEKSFHALTGELQVLYDGSAAEYSQPARLAYLSYSPTFNNTKLLVKASIFDSPTMWGARFGGAGVDGFGAIGLDERSYHFQRAALVGEVSHTFKWSKVENHVIAGVEGQLERFFDSVITAPIAGTCDDPGKPTHKSCSKTFADDAMVFTGSVYAFDELRLGERIRLSAGARINAATEDYYKPAVLFKAGVVVELLRDVFAKVNFDEGMRPPPMMARYVVSAWHQPLAKPEVERSRVISSQINAKRSFPGKAVSSLYGSVGYSHVQLKNVVTFVPGTQTRLLPFYLSLPDDLVVHSLEATVRAGLWKLGQVWLTANHDIRQKVAIQNFSFGPETTFTFGGRVKFPFGLSAVLRNRLTLPYARRVMYRVPDDLIARPVASNAAEFTVYPSYELDLGAQMRWGGLGLQLMVYNISDNRIADIDQTEFMFGHANGAVVPAAGRSVHLRLEYVY